ncbi:VOC family protein [Adhaeribacter swui]|uniref:VOC family protein n=1 Tax=Adhaeribacter swui TaxID=2086471 RepID=A0A7G7G9Z8_9BACT|nr:VOC family protein [Adhaeribacter swui]QNF33982.1 VOC family protein [Adhaeribacter swui]
MVKLNPYLNFNGTAEAAFNFYKSVFGGEFANLIRFKDTGQGTHLSAEDQEKIMHIALPIGPNNILMATDALEAMGHSFKPGTNFQLSLSPDSEAEADRLFQALSAGGQATMPMHKEFWGAYFGMLTDPYGVQWMISYDPNIPA